MVKYLVACALFLGLALPAQAFDGHRVKKVVEKVKAFRAKHLPKPPDVKPVEPKPAPKPVKVTIRKLTPAEVEQMLNDPAPRPPQELHRGDHRFGRLRSWLASRRHPDSGPDYTPSAPSSHPSLKPVVKPEKLPPPKDKKPAPKP